MCGRTALTLGKEEILKKCVLQRKGSNNEKKKVTEEKIETTETDGQSVKASDSDDPGLEQNIDIEPVWRDAPCGGEFSPSPNIAPTVYTPVLYTTSSGRTVLQPMMWGLIPPWHPGPGPKTHGLSTNNCRLEGLTSSKLYSPCLRSGRCVVVCEGFYEWLRPAAGDKQPYIVRRPATDHDSAPLLYMAGLMSVWQETVRSYSIITRESNTTLSWLHHRMPAFLHPHQVSHWLDPDTHTTTALQLLDQGVPGEGELTWHKVSKEVGNSRNQSVHLMNKMEEKEKKLPGIMANWLQSSSNKPSNSNQAKSPQPPVKKKEDKSKSLMSSWLKRSHDNDPKNANDSKKLK